METKTDNSQENINILVNKCLHLVQSWTNKEVGDFAMWMDLINPVSKIINQQKDKTQIDNIELTINIIQRIANKYYELNKDKLDGPAREILDVVMSDTGKMLLRSSTSLLGKLLRDIDTNNDGKISGDECAAFMKKVFPCCFPIAKK